MADKMEIVERTEPITIEEVFDFIDDTSIGKMDAHELKSRIADMEHEVRAKAIDEFAERMKERLKGMQMAELQGEDVCPCSKSGEDCPYMYQNIGCQYCAREQTIKDIEEVAEQLKEGGKHE